MPEEHTEPQDLVSVVRNLTQFSSPWVRPVRFWQRSVKVHVEMRVLSVLDVVSWASLYFFINKDDKLGDVK